ncbi:MAG: hypothetical protein ACOC93_02640 [Planctomycetota bacterium]
MRRTLLIALLVGGLVAPGLSDDLLRETQHGETPVPVKVEGQLRNPAWPAEWEKGLHDRGQAVLKQTLDMNVGANTYFENEKRCYGHLMMQALAGRKDALNKLQAEDAQAGSWHKHTKGIDYFACFTIKHQMRKYFYFGDLLDPAYKQRMYEGAKIWTEKDPLRRPHHAYKGAGGWTPEAKNSWVDTRGTDNLWWMRTCGVYLMAEETGNEQTRRKYKEHIRRHVAALYRIGMGEWDSENYLGHSITPVIGLYDFAKDPEVKMLAKAALDWMFTSGAVKYWRGGYNGPTKRDYNHPYPLGGSAAGTFWFYFGQYPRENHHIESDEVHAWTSMYRPPLAVGKLARKEFDRPREIFACKPDYGAPQAGRVESDPSFYETTYFGKTFQLGTLAKGSGRGDVNGFKILCYSSDNGADYIVPAPTGNPKRTGSPQYGDGFAGPGAVGQNRNLAIWLVRSSDTPWLWVLPRSIQMEQADGVTFLQAEKTWLAIHPIGMEIRGQSSELSEKLAGRDDDPDLQVLAGRATGEPVSGFAIEIGEQGTHGDYTSFKKEVLSESKLDASQSDEGTAAYTGANGNSVKVQFSEKLADLKVWRNGKLHDWDEHAQAAYREAGKPVGEGLISQAWNGDGTLRVDAGGEVFECTVTSEGDVTFSNSKAD